MNPTLLLSERQDLVLVLFRRSLIRQLADGYEDVDFSNQSEVVEVRCPEREAVEGFYSLNDSSVFFNPSSAVTGIFSIPKAVLSFWLDTTYDSVNFFNRSLFKGK